MNSTGTLKQKVDRILGTSPDLDPRHDIGWPTILVATVDPGIHRGLAELFLSFRINAIWSKSVDAAKNFLAKEKVTACLCGFWLQDGTYRELVQHLRRERGEIPVIIVSAPACPHKFRDYLAAVNIGAHDFLSHPYRMCDLERMLRQRFRKSIGMPPTEDL